MYQIKFSKLAIQDLDTAYSYIANDLKNQKAAENLVLEAERRIYGIQEYPYSCSVIKDLYSGKLEIRFLPIKNYIAVIQIDEKSKVISVVRILYGKREWRKMLKDGIES